jgi:hypothetical protein
VTSGAQNKARQLAELADSVIAQHRDGEDPDVPDAIRFVAPHGLTRSVDREVRRFRAEETAWGDLDPDVAGELARLDPGLVVLFGAHRNGYVREAMMDIASSLTHVPGVVSMLAYRTVDRVPPVRESAQETIRSLFEAELQNDAGGVMPTVVNRAAKGVVASPDSVIECPDLVILALKLFETRTARWRRDRGRDHHERTLREVDRRSQVLDHLRRLTPPLDNDASREATSQLIEFYEHSLLSTPRGTTTAR